MTDKYIDLARVENSVKLKAVDLGDDTYALAIDGNISIDASDIEIGAVEIKDSATDTRTTVDADGLHVSVQNTVELGAGETHIGQIGGEGIGISQTPTVTAGAYSANDAVGGLLTFAGAARVSGDTCFLKNVLIFDDAGQDAVMELWLFDRTFTAMADNAAWAPSQADLRNLVAIISTIDGSWFAAGTPSVARVEVSQQLPVAATSLYGQLVTRGTPTFAATDDVTVKISLMQE